MLLSTSNEDRDDGRLTKQFFRCTRDISADVAWLLRLLESGAMMKIHENEGMRREKLDDACDIQTELNGTTGFQISDFRRAENLGLQVVAVQIQWLKSITKIHDFQALSRPRRDLVQFPFRIFNALLRPAPSINIEEQKHNSIPS